MSSTLTAPTEHDRVLAWQLEMLLDLGFEVPEAELIAWSGCDWHRVNDLLSQGCPRELVLRII